MRTRGSIMLAVSFAMLASANDARAEGAIVARGGASAAIVGARVVASLEDDRTTRWMEVTVEGNQSGFLWLVPAAASARVDTASHRWMVGVDQASKASVEGSAVDDIVSVSPTAAEVAGDERTLEAMVVRGGGSLSAVDALTFAPMFDEGRVVLVIEYDATASRVTTGVVVITEPGVHDLELPWTDDPTTLTPVTLLVLGRGPATLAAEGWFTESAQQGDFAIAAGAETSMDAGVGSTWLTRLTGTLPGGARGVVVSTGSRAVIAPVVKPAADAAGRDASADVGPTGEEGVLSAGVGGTPAPASAVVPPVMGGAVGNGDDDSSAVADIADSVGDAASDGCDGSSASEPDDSGSGCDSSSGSSDDASSGCSGSSSSDSSSDCAVQRSGRRSRGLGVRGLVFGMAALAWVRRASGRRRRLAIQREGGLLGR